MKWQDKLPDTKGWMPTTPPKAREALKQALRLTCNGAQRRIVQEGMIERSFNVQNFDSGLGLEDIVRRELRDLLPSRYTVSPGTVDDGDGATAGDCDVLVSNRMWAPVVKLGATSESRGVHFPIEAIYSVVEIKQTLSYGQLDEAMKKLVTVSRLNRPRNPYGHITENQHITQFDKEGLILNPLYTVVLATRTVRGVAFSDLASRFFHINRQLARDDMVKMLCVLDHGVAFYTVRPDSGPAISADFCRDRAENLTETIYDHDQNDCFYKFFVELFGHLTRSVLAISELNAKYGIPNVNVRHVSVDSSLDYVPPRHP